MRSEAAAAIARATAGDGTAAQRRDVALLFGGEQLQRQVFHPRRAKQVIAGHDLGVVGLLGSDLVAKPERVAALPKVAVAGAGVEPQRRGVGAVAVVELHIGGERRFGLLDFQVHVKGAGLGTGLDFRGDLAVLDLVKPGEVAGNVVKVKRLPFGQRRHILLELGGRGVARAAHAGLRDHTLGDVDGDDAVGGVLCGHLYEGGLITFGAVKRLDGNACPLDIVGGSLGPEKRVHRFLDFLGFEHVHALDAEFLDQEA